MRKNKYILVVAFVLSNLLWAYAYFNIYVYSQYQEGSLKGHKQYIEQLLAIIPVVSTGEATRKEVSKAAKLGNKLGISNETNSTVQIGGLTFGADENNKFVEIIR